MIHGVRAALVLAILAYAPALIEQFETPKAAVVAVLGAGLLAAALASVLGARAAPAAVGGGRSARGDALARWHTLDLCILAWLGVAIASTATSVAPTISLHGDSDQRAGLLVSIGLAGLFAATRRATPDAASARRTLDVCLGAIAAACLVALWQLATFDRARWESAPEYLGWYRPFGSLGHANLLGLAAAAGFSAMLVLGAARGMARVWRVAGLLLFAATTVLTLSRAAWLALVAGSLAALMVRRRLRGRAAEPERRGRPGRAALAWSLAGILLAVAIVAAVEPLRARVLEMVALGSGSGRSRREIWASAVAMWRAHPWLGSGPDTFRLLFDRFQTPGYWRAEWGAAPFHAHSIYLDTLATRGVSR